MKRWWVLLLVLIVIPSVSAIINIDGPSKEVFNLGDIISVKGYILETEDMWGLFKLNLNCDTDIPLITRTISLKKDEKFIFDESLTLPFYLSGQCTLEATVDSDGNIIEQIMSRPFTITKDLEGKFSVKDNLVQLGKDVVLEGNVYKKDGTNVNGLATLYFKLGGKVSFVDMVNVINGKLNYIQSSTAHQAGIYDLEISVFDNYGNSQIFANAVQFTLVDEIYVFAKPTREQVVPGSTVHLIGEAKTILQADVDEGNVLIAFDEEEYKTTFKNSKFSYDISLPDNIKSGKHLIEVFVEDSLGNKGSTETGFEVTPVPTTLKAEISEGVPVPGSTITIKPILIDQGDDLIIEDISVEVISAGGDIEYSTVVKTDEAIVYEFSQYAKPGNWEIRTYATGLKSENSFSLGETISADFDLENQTLVVVNTGNIKYKKPLEIIFSSGTLTETVIAKVSLGPGESESINLGHYVESGVYDITIGDNSYSGVSITGAKKINYDWIFWVIIIAFLSLLVYLFLFRGKRLRNLIRRKKEEKSHIEIIREEIKREKSEPKLSTFEQEANKKKYAKEFRDKILKELEKRKPHLKVFREKEENKPSPVRASDLVKRN